MKRLLAFLSLFSSLSTLICCAIPAALVSLGLGATLASTLSSVPQLIWFSEHKELVFGFAGICLIITLVSRMFSQNLSCPVDPELARACTNARKISSAIFYLSLFLFLTGGFFAFIIDKI